MSRTSQWTEEWQSVWQSRLSRELPQTKPEARQSIMRWLPGENYDKLNQLTAEEVLQFQQQANRRYQILRQRYLAVNPRQAYLQLLNRLGAVVACPPSIRHRLSRCPSSRQAVAAIIQEVLQDLLDRDAYCQQQRDWIAGCTEDDSLRDALFFASLEEYCLRASGQQFLFVEQVIVYLRQKQARKLAAYQACA